MMNNLNHRNVGFTVGHPILGTTLGCAVWDSGFELQIYKNHKQHEPHEHHTKFLTRAHKAET